MQPRCELYTTLTLTRPSPYTTSVPLVSQMLYYTRTKKSWSLCLWEDYLLLDIFCDSLSILSADILSQQHFRSHSLLDHLKSTTLPFSYCLRYLKPSLLCWAVLSLNFYSLIISNISLKYPLKYPNTLASQIPHKLWF